MLHPPHFQAIFSDLVLVSVVIDNARTHTTSQDSQQQQEQGQLVQRRNSDPASVLASSDAAPTPKTRSYRRSGRRRTLRRLNSYPPKKPQSRWESESSDRRTPSLTNCMLPSKMPARATTTTSVVVPATTATHSLPPPSSSPHRALHKPVRRQSIDDPEILAQLHESLSNLDQAMDSSSCTRKSHNTASILAKALDSLDLYEPDGF